MTFRSRCDRRLLMVFPGIFGHERSLALLQSAIASNRVHHAYLFAGPEGVGKEKIARLFALLLLCEKEEPSDRPCVACEGCRKVKEGIHPDLIFSLPEAEAVARGLLSKSDLDKTPSRDFRVAEVRELEKRVRLPPYQGRHKVAIISPADRMNQSAQNALLKTLEEPPSSTTIILVTAALDGLLPTIRSRCAKIHFGPLPLDLVAHEVARKKSLSLQDARVLAAMGAGSLGAALALDLETLEQRRELIGSLRKLDPGDGTAITLFAERFVGDRAEAEEKLGMISIWYRDILALKSGADASVLLNVDSLSDVAEDADRIPARELTMRLDAIAIARRDIAGNVNARLVVEGLLSSFSKEGG